MSSKVSPKVEDLVAIEFAAASSPDFQFGLYNNYFPRCPYISGAHIRCLILIQNLNQELLCWLHLSLIFDFLWLVE